MGTAEKSNKKKLPFKSASDIIGASKDHYVPDYEEEEGLRQRLVLATAALQKRGKSRFGFTMPKPLAYMQLDANYEHVLTWARKTYKGKNAIQHLSYFADPRGDLKTTNLQLWERFLRDFDYCVQNFKSVMVDTMSELMDVRKLAEYGRNTQIPQIYYGSIYADFRLLVKHALKHDANVAFLHRMRDQYIKDERTGEIELQGWRGILYETQVYVEHQRSDDGVFTSTIQECAQDSMLIGMTLGEEDSENDFPELATRIFSDTERNDWI